MDTIQLQIDEHNRQIIKHNIERNRLIVENKLGTDMLVPEYKLDSNGKFISVNIKFAEMLGYSSVAEIMSEINTGKYLILKSDLLAMFADSDYIIDKPLCLRTKTGSYLNLMESMIRIEENGQTTYIGLMKYRDSYGRQKQGNALFWNTVNQLYGSIKSGTMICDRNTILMYVNSAMRQIIGLDDIEDLPSLYIENYIDPKDRKKIKTSIDKLFRTEMQTQQIGFSLIKKSGENVSVTAYSSIIDFEEQKFCVTIITPANKKDSIDEEDSKKVIRPFRETIDALSELCLLVTPEGDICDINNAAVKMWGWDYKSYLSKSIFSLGKFSKHETERNIGNLCNDDGLSEYLFLAKNTIWGDIPFTAKVFYATSNDARHIAIVLENRREIQQIMDNLSIEYRNNLALFENSLCGIIQMQNGEIVKVNSRAYSLLKINNDIRGHHITDILKVTKRKKRSIVVTAPNRKEEIFDYEVISNDNRVVLEMHIYDIDKENSLCYFTPKNVRKSNSLMRDAVSRYKVIVEQSPCGVLIGDKHGNIIDVSDRFCEMIKMPPREILGKNIVALFTTNSVSSKPLDYTHVDEGEIINAERELKCGDGTVKVVEMYSSAISSDMYQAVILDITSRKIYENQMLGYRKRIQDMDLQKAHFKKMSKDVTVIFGANAEIKDVFVGEKFPFFEYSKTENEFTERFISYMMRKEYDMIIRQCVTRIIEGESSETQNVEVAIGGIPYEFELRFSSIENDALMVVSDVTDRNRSIRELNAALKKAEESENLQSVFLSNLSHELRTPMNGIIGFADLLLEGEKDPQKQEYLKIILDSSNQLHNVLSDIIEMSKLEAGTVQAKTEIIGLKKIIADICASIQSDRLIAENNVQIVNLAQEHEEVLIISDNVKLRQIIINLMNNAIKFTKNGKVEIDYSVDNEKVCIIVRDNGVGIAKEDIDNIFDRFYQTKNVDLATKGSGLGLAIVKSYIDILHGKISVESEVGKGSCFYVELPSRY